MSFEVLQETLELETVATGTVFLSLADQLTTRVSSSLSFAASRLVTLLTRPKFSASPSLNESRLLFSAGSMRLVEMLNRTTKIDQASGSHLSTYLPTFREVSDSVSTCRAGAIYYVLYYCM